MSKKYPNLSKPFQIGNVTLKNRYIMAPMDTGPTFLNVPPALLRPGAQYSWDARPL